MSATRRNPTWVVVAGLVCLGLAAGVDALREERKAERTFRPHAAPPAVVSQLRAAGVRGILTYSDDRCRLHAVRLPGLEPAPAPGVESCEPHIPTGGITAWEGDVVWSGLGFRTVQVVLSSDDLERSLRTRGWEGDVRAVQAVRLDQDRLAVLTESTDPPRERMVAGLEDQRLRFLLPSWRIGSAEVVRPSPTGRYFTVRDSGEPWLRLFGSGGWELPLPPVTQPHAVAWSPDERWTALAARSAVYVFRTEEPWGPVVEIPLAVRDLDWDA
jgi:hypothetical protein